VTRAAEAGLGIVTLADRPDLTDAAIALIERNWPRFVLFDEVSVRLAPRVVTDLAEFQLLLLDAGGGPIGVGVSVPLRWPRGADPPAGWDATLARAVADLDAGLTPTVACALSATVDARHQGRGLSPLLVQALKDHAATHGLPELLIPVRPTHKARYPLTPIERYVRWRTPGGAPFDPWLRTHWRGGAEVVAVAPASMRVTGTVAQWEAWTGMRFPDSGAYVVPGALVPVDIDRGLDLGVYVEPNVWMRHVTGTPWADRRDPA
jgi:GNAT superfamily N-acetyltransferase